MTELEFICQGCDYSTKDLREGMGHSAGTGHTLERQADDEGTTMTISLEPAEDEDREYWDADEPEYEDEL